MFAEMCENCGITFIGPSAESMRLMGDKLSAIRAMQEAGVPCVPGSGRPLTDDVQDNIALARAIGYPVIIKASGGGGGRGMRVVHTEAALNNAVQTTRQEAASEENQSRRHNSRLRRRRRRRSGSQLRPQKRGTFHPLPGAARRLLESNGVGVLV